MSEHEPITQELRECMSHLFMSDKTKSELLSCCDNIDAIHRLLEAENERIRKTQDGWIKLPVDADGVAIHEGDELWSDTGIWVMVKRFEYENGQWDVFVENKVGTGFYVISEDMHHYCPDTWESIINDAMQAGRADVAVDVMPLIKRCKALCEHTREE